MQLRRLANDAPADYRRDALGEVGLACLGAAGLHVTLNENGITFDFPRTVTVIVPRAILPLAFAGVLNVQRPRPPATFPFAGTDAVPTRTEHLAVPDATPTPVSTRVTGAETTTAVPAFGFTGAPSGACPPSA